MITLGEVEQIRVLYNSGRFSSYKIAPFYCVTPQYVWQLCTRDSAIMNVEGTSSTNGSSKGRRSVWTSMVGQPVQTGVAPYLRVVERLDTANSEFPEMELEL